ncbi:MAG: amino acid deaminase/aldolase [Actinomycetota bacterium]
MTLELRHQTDTPWLAPAEYWPMLTRATAQLDPPLGAIYLPALAWNAFDMLRRANGTKIRVASKSVRVRGVIDAVLELDGFEGVLSYALAEALWLAEGDERHQPIEDVVVGYPSVDRSAIHHLATSPELAARVTIMVDSVDQLDAVDAVIPPAKRETIRVCMELDAAWKHSIAGRFGAWRSPIASVHDARELASAIVARPGFELVGLMSYESQIAGTTNEPQSRARGAVVRWMQSHSIMELADRRREVVTAVNEITALRFVNGGGTGSLETTSAEDAVTEIAAGSGLFGPHLFDHYRHFAPAPAAVFALPVVRKPRPEVATLLGGGWVASGPPGVDRLPLVAWPEGLDMEPREMAGEVQTPLLGHAARELAVGDRVWLRHTKAGELSEHLNGFAIVDGERVIGAELTYRGEGQVFL